jgi:regulatory protein YycI of two-component signal transduction system YycFG
MKKIIFIFLAYFATQAVSAQFSNKKFKGTLKLETDVEVVFNFKADTLNVYRALDSANLETMVFTANDTLLTLKKVEGQSSCDVNTLGKYKYVLKGDDLTFILFADDCTDRSSVLDNTKWTRMK